LAKPIFGNELFHASLTVKLLLLVVGEALSSIFHQNTKISWCPYNRKLHEDWSDVPFTTWSSTEKNLTKTFLNIH